ncbi:PilW family protein [Aquitalea magnusonii]|uniref:Tfp pilus assembly protein PilW n=1 Tax=Aquitalea magnusonii TaxID=332411 RepID=A0A318J9N3_9NEIS|nr:hypothetical protein [Aquitalea magnusonii]PXX46008.1 hypothetical protein DFR38_110106 [Aquitalea magnusonii]
MPAARGFSLVELMLSSLLGLLLCGLLWHSLHAVLQTRSFASTRLASQQEARFVLQQLARDLRMAGSFACAGPAQWLASGSQVMPQAGEGVLSLSYGDGGIALLAEPADSQGQISRWRLLQPPPAWPSEQPLLLASCRRVDLLKLDSDVSLQQQDGAFWLQLAVNSPLRAHMAEHHLPSLELLALQQRHYRLDQESAEGKLWLEQTGQPQLWLASGIARLHLQAETLPACPGSAPRSWWTLQLAMRQASGSNALPYRLQVMSRAGPACLA